MKKSNFIAMIFGTVSGIFFALGMCMALLPEWNAFWPGVILGGSGLALGGATLLIWRKMEGKPLVSLNRKAILAAAVSAVGALGLGIGMCFSMVWGQMALGIAIGVTGILLLLGLVPLVRGVK